MAQKQRGSEQKGTKDCIRGDSEATHLQRAITRACSKARDIRWAISKPWGIFTMSQLSAFCVGSGGRDRKGEL